MADAETQRKHMERMQRNYRNMRRVLIIAMGGACADCGEDDPGQLEFDHLKYRKWVAASHNRVTRMHHYYRDFLDGVLELRCGKCNKKKGAPPSGEDEVPF